MIFDKPCDRLEPLMSFYKLLSNTFGIITNHSRIAIVSNCSSKTVFGAENQQETHAFCAEKPAANAPYMGCLGRPDPKPHTHYMGCCGGSQTNQPTSLAGGFLTRNQTPSWVLFWTEHRNTTSITTLVVSLLWSEQKHTLLGVVFWHRRKQKSNTSFKLIRPKKP